MLAGIVAVGILSLILCAYSILPLHIDNSKGNTDYVWQSNSIWVKMTEGTSWGRFDANGYNNQKVIELPDILVTGSSHMEATNVMQSQNTVSLLNDKLNGRYSVYNVGISGHFLPKACQYLEKNIQLYQKNLKAVIIETASVSITAEELNQILTGTVEKTESHATGLIALLQKIPFCRQVYQQITGGLLDLFMPTSKTAEEKAEAAKQVDSSVYSGLFSYLAEVEEKYGVQLIIVYHPTGNLQEDGTIEFSDSEELHLFSANAEKYGISFINMTSAFEEMYYTEHHVAHGFANGKLATGHLNKYGHEAIAESLFDEINSLEEAGLICK